MHLFNISLIAILSGIRQISIKALILVKMNYQQIFGTIRAKYRSFLKKWQKDQSPASPPEMETDKISNRHVVSCF